MKLQNLCYINNSVKIIDFDDVHMETFDTFFINLGITKSKIKYEEISQTLSLSKNKFKKYIEIFMHITVIYQILFIINNKINITNIGNIDIYIKNIVELISKKLNLTKINSFMYFIEERIEFMEIIMERMTHNCDTMMLDKILENHENILKKSANKKLLIKLESFKKNIDKVVGKNHHFLTICKLLKQYLINFKKARSLSKRYSIISSTKKTKKTIPKSI